MPIRSLLLTCLLSCALAILVAQGRTDEEERNTFGLSVLVGANFSQIDGDNFRGYDHIGLYAGLRGIVRVTSRFEIYLELLYSQKGSRFESRESVNASNNRVRYIKLDYAEVPILGALRLTGDHSQTRVWLEGGISIARLINSRVMDSPDPSPSEFPYSEIEDAFEQTDVNVICGVSVNPTPWLGLGLRGTWGVKRFYEAEDFDPSATRENVEFLRNYSLTMYAMYHF